jgi:tetratricopeptide (TPR) repeat protein
MSPSASPVSSRNARLPHRFSLARAFLFAALAITLRVAWLTPLAGGADPQSESASHADKGLQLAQAGDLAGSEAELRKAVQLAPGDAHFLADLGTVLAMENKLEDSTRCFERALKLDPGDATIRRYLAANLWQLNRYREARQHLELILKQRPEDNQSRLLLGMVAENTRDYATAAKMLASVPSELRERPESTAALARSYYHLGETEKARNTLDEFLTNPRETKAVLMGAQIADEAHDYDTAEKLLTSARTNFPDLAALNYRLALVEYHAEQFDKSQTTLLGLLTAGYRNSQVLNLLAWCYRKQNQSSEAVQALGEAIDLAPSEESNYVDLIEILAATGSLPSALNAAKRSTAALPGSHRIFLERGSVELKMSQFTDAIASYNRALELDPANPDGLLGMAEAEDAAGMKREAAAHYETGMNRFPKDTRFKLQFALMLQKAAESGDTASQARAEQLLRSALALDHTLPAAHYQLGDLALKRGHLLEAVEELKQAAQLDPTSAKACYALARAYRRLGRNEDAAREMELYQKLKADEPRLISAPAGMSQP